MPFLAVGSTAKSSAVIVVPVDTTAAWQFTRTVPVSTRIGK